MPIQEYGDLINIVLERGVNKYDVELRQLNPEKSDKSANSDGLRYRKTRHASSTNPYCITLIDPISDVALVEIQAQKSSSKMKQILLFQPDEEIPFENTGKINFEYKFTWENEEYYWQKRGGLFSKDLECKMVHDPDPSIGIALYQQKSNTLGIVTLMYWNMDRIPVNDKRGLECVLCITLLSFLDEWDDKLLNKSMSLVKGQDKVNLTYEPQPNIKYPTKKKKDKPQEKQEHYIEHGVISPYPITPNTELEQQRYDEELAKQPNSPPLSPSHQHPNPLPVPPYAQPQQQYHQQQPFYYNQPTIANQVLPPQVAAPYNPQSSSIQMQMPMPMPSQAQQSPAINSQQQYPPIYAHGNYTPYDPNSQHQQLIHQQQQQATPLPPLPQQFPPPQTSQYPPNNYGGWS
ncbi:5262_t:CDS:2 [Ambispora leptoticha]|uniref:5262_t:CDS:1 n=1 Tax=Ambispora leptoticha TaxID=144679 RepID=A0A9N9F9Y9_9GLOM|nr:5262_t:CDS:2 [Ambispora leptoticha]